MPRKRRSPLQEKISAQNPVSSYIDISKDVTKISTSSFGAVNKSKGSYMSDPYYDFSNLDGGISGRPGLTRDGYYAFRPAEAPATTFPDIIKDVNQVYKKVGLIRNIIDLMGDFGSSGIRISHPNKTSEKILRNWWDKVNGDERSERWLNLFYREGMVVVTKQMAKINKSKLNKLKQAHAAELEATFTNPTKSEIPWKYIFLDPVFTKPITGPFVSMMSTPRHGIVIPTALKRIIISPRNDVEAALVRELPSVIKEAANNTGVALLDPEFTSVYHYKKDDWEAWAYPMIYAVMDDIYNLEKLRLADMAALDGAISSIRIFKLGNLEYKIAPSDEAAAKLAEVLASHTGVGSMDVVWGPDIELIESKTSVHQFLGPEKYEACLNAIYTGLGIPPTLTGTGGTGTTNNYVSLKTLMQRLNYGRNMLKKFWMGELIHVQKALGLPLEAEIEFDIENLGNEESEKALLIQLADRGLISEELIHARFNKNARMEGVRIQREEKDRAKGKMPAKASPFHRTDKDQELKRVALQTGQATPAQVGLELEEGVADEKKMMDIQTGPTNSPKQSGGTGGRPKNAGDTTKRKEKTFTPKVKAIEMWAAKALDKIAEFAQPNFLLLYNKKDLRALSHEEINIFEQIKFNILMSIEPQTTITAEVVNKSILEQKSYHEAYAECLDLENEVGGNLTLNERRNIQAYIYGVNNG